MTADCDWSVLTEEVDGIAGRAAARVSEQYPRLEREDLHQEARIIACTHPVKVNNYVEGDHLGHLSRWLWERLTDSVKTEAKYLEQNVSYERELERYATVES